MAFRIALILGTPPVVLIGAAAGSYAAYFAASELGADPYAAVLSATAGCFVVLFAFSRLTRRMLRALTPPAQTPTQDLYERFD
jgi:hypothetical protein